MSFYTKEIFILSEQRSKTHIYRKNWIYNRGIMKRLASYAPTLALLIVSVACHVIFRLVVRLVHLRDHLDHWSFQRLRVRRGVGERASEWVGDKRSDGEQ